MKKIISMILSLCMIAAFINVPVIIASAASNSDEVVLFSDNFESYTGGISFTSSTYGKYWENELATDKFKLFAGLGGGVATATGFTEAAPGEIAQIATATESGIGTGSSLKITAQLQAKSNQLTRYSGITESAIADKSLVFKTTFTVPEFVGLGDGIGVYLAPGNAGGNVTSATAEVHLSTSATYKDGELMYLGARSDESSWDRIYADLGNGTVCNQLWTFGEKVADLEAGETYTYIVTMTPDEETGKYDVETDLNGTKLTLGQSAYATSSTVPTIDQMATFTDIKMMRLVHEWYFTVGYCDNNIGNIGSTNIGVTNAQGLYDNDRAVAYFDDMSLTVEDVVVPEPEVGEPLFTDNFESYTGGISFTNDTYGKYWANNLATDKFKLFAGLGGGAATATGFTEAAPGEIAQIATATESGIGTGSSLKITAQLQAKNNQFTRYSGITESAIADKNLVFKTTFTVPEFVGFGDGVGVYLAPYNEGGTATSTVAGSHLSTDTTQKAGELMYLGARSDESDWNKFYADLGNGTVCNQLWTFGEKVADLEAGETYTYTVTMTPNEETGKYDVETDLNGTKLTLGQSAYATSSTVPTVAEMANYTTIRMMRLVHEWYFTVGYCDNNIGNIGSTNIGVTNAQGLYDNDRAVAYFDDMSLRVVEEVNMKAIASSLINANATVEGNTVTVKIISGKATDYTPVVIAAAYDSNDKMLKIVINDTTVIPAGGKDTATLTGLPAEYDYIKVFIWDTMENLEPVTESYTPDRTDSKPGQDEEDEPEINKVLMMHSIYNADSGILGETHWLD